MTLGFDRKVHTSWLDLTARLAAEGLPPTGIRDHLHKALDGEVAGDTPQSARGKTKTVLLRIWVTVPPSAARLRDDALEIVAGGDIADLRPLHWGMCLATHPFFRDVAATAGRLLALQESVAMGAVTRRVAERWGVRSTVPRASQRVVGSMVELGALAEAERRGVYRRGKSIGVPDEGPLPGWLTEAAMVASGRQSMRLGSLARHPMLFPFPAFATARHAMGRQRLELFSEGSGEDVVGLKDLSAGRG